MTVVNRRQMNQMIIDVVKVVQCVDTEVGLGNIKAVAEGIESNDLFVERTANRACAPTISVSAAAGRNS